MDRVIITVAGIMVQKIVLY